MLLKKTMTVLVLLASTTLGADKTFTAKPAKGEPVPTDPFVISTDTAVWGQRVSQQIPAIARVGSRWFCIWYGVNKGPRGISGEGPGCYNTLAMSEDDCQTWKELAYFVPNPIVAAQGVIDPRLIAMPEGPLLLFIPVSGQKSRSVGLCC